ncbi:MAG: hypothetical protein R8P61_19155 [Bacteroidia bacterium]|nr:hypothetical protein [Bacteroidia bacterium]
MKLSPSDIKRLYGDKLFILPEPEKSQLAEEPVQEAKEETLEVAAVPTVEAIVEEVKEEVVPVIDLSPLQSGQQPVWKMKPGARLALILHKSEFSNKEFTGLLKASMLTAAIDLTQIGFGVIEDDARTLDLRDMGVPFAVLCDKLDSSLSSPVEMEGKKIWLSPHLAEAIKEVSAKTELETIMKEVAGEM